MKTRLLKRKLNLQIGERSISYKHLEFLVGNVDKNEHLLAISDLDCKDKMKFKPVQKIMNPLVSSALGKYCESSSGTVLFISLMNDINDSFINTKIPCRLRLFKIWRSLFIVRAWKVWLLKSKELTLKHNFITSNTVTCIELNAHAMVKIIQELRNTQNDNLFLPWLMGSQACESMFRSARSCSPNQITSVNFNIAEFLGRQKRIQLCNDIPVELDGIFQFPRATNITPTEKSVETSLPNDIEIDNIINEALTTALSELKSVGINATEEDLFTCATNVVSKVVRCPEDIERLEHCELVAELGETESSELESIQTNFQFYDFEKDLSVGASEEYKRGKYIQIYNKKSRKIEEINKTTLCWYLNKEVRKPSADRDRRFIPRNSINRSEQIR